MMNLQILDLLFKPLLLLVLLGQLTPISAQTSNVTCLSSWAWTLNSRQQTPCLVAAYLLAPCADNQWDVPALQNGEHYLPPTVATANQCQCSTVIYQLMSACDSCQGQDITAWSSWSASCAAGLVSIASYPKPIPGATSVPAWAYINIVAADRFNATVAVADIGQPESSAVGATTTTPTSTPASTSTTGSSSSTSAISQTGGGGSKNDTGAIVGGVVGGIVGLGLIVCLILFLVKRNSQPSRKRSAPSAEFSKVIPPGSPVPANFDPAVVGFRSRTASPMSNGLSTDGSTGGYGMQNMHYAAMNYGNGHPAPAAVGMGVGGSPWSPPPVGHTPAPSSGHYSTIYTPPPPEMGQSNMYTPPPGSLQTGSGPYQQHSHSNSVNTYQSANPYVAPVHRSQNSNTSFTRPSGYPEM